MLRIAELDDTHKNSESCMSALHDQDSGFMVLASGSAGNSAFYRSNCFGLLLDLGIEPRLIGSRLAMAGLSWEAVDAAVLTHVHSDHWKEWTLKELLRRRIPLHCGAGHLPHLRGASDTFRELEKLKLVRTFPARSPVVLEPGLELFPIRVPHDANPTFGFVITRSAGLFGDSYRMIYASDLGSLPQELLDQFSSANLIALEFNHDVEMQQASRRPHFLIRRVLSDGGHLSNEQAAEAIFSACDMTRIQHVVQLHLSQECNSPRLSREAIFRRMAEDLHFQLVTANQHEPTAWLPTKVGNLG
jgi:phosphoribosyl 1,2-cyclic phosphodiesterase